MVEQYTRLVHAVAGKGNETKTELRRRLGYNSWPVSTEGQPCSSTETTLPANFRQYPGHRDSQQPTVAPPECLNLETNPSLFLGPDRGDSATETGHYSDSGTSGGEETTAPKQGEDSGSAGSRTPETPDTNKSSLGSGGPTSTTAKAPGQGDGAGDGDNTMTILQELEDEPVGPLRDAAEIATENWSITEVSERAKYLLSSYQNKRQKRIALKLVQGMTDGVLMGKRTDPDTDGELVQEVLDLEKSVRENGEHSCQGTRTPGRLDGRKAWAKLLKHISSTRLNLEPTTSSQEENAENQKRSEPHIAETTTKQADHNRVGESARRWARKLAQHEGVEHILGLLDSNRLRANAPTKTWERHPQLMTCMGLIDALLSEDRDDPWTESEMERINTHMEGIRASRYELLLGDNGDDWDAQMTSALGRRLLRKLGRNTQQTRREEPKARKTTPSQSWPLTE